MFNDPTLMIHWLFFISDIEEWLKRNAPYGLKPTLGGQRLLHSSARAGALRALLHDAISHPIDFKSEGATKTVPLLKQFLSYRL